MPSGASNSNLEMPPSSSPPPALKTTFEIRGPPKESTEASKAGEAVSSRPTLSFSDPGKGKEKEATPADTEISRRSSVTSLRFTDTPRPRDMPRRVSKVTFDRTRVRAASPPPSRFRPHVAFETTGHQELNKGPAGITLNEKHNGFRHERRSKTFMVGVDENSYSEEALEWLLTSMVDDHDTVVCVRVIDKDVKGSMRDAYLEEARKFMREIIKKNTLNKAIAIVVEYQFGRLGQTFESLVSVHQPSMLVVGTKGKTKQGMQGVWNTRNSFSKYCLEKSAVPVVVVRPKEVREKKKSKRAKDPTRNTYAQMLAASGGLHESDYLNDEAVLERATQLSSAEEASQVAKALSLPAEYDPTIKKYKKSIYDRSRQTSSSALSPSDAETVVQAEVRKASSTQGDSSEEEGDEDDGLEGFDGAGKRLAEDPNKKAKLHNMEVNEAAALRRRNTNEEDEDDE